MRSYRPSLLSLAEHKVMANVYSYLVDSPQLALRPVDLCAYSTIYMVEVKVDVIVNLAHLVPDGLPDWLSAMPSEGTASPCSHIRSNNNVRSWIVRNRKRRPKRRNQ